MRITKKLESEILQVMEDFWGSYLKGDIDKWASFLPDDYRNIGTTKEEIWESKSDIIEYTQRVFSQAVGMAETRNKKTQIIPYEPYVMVHELGDLYVKAEEGWIFYAPFRLSSLLEKKAEGWQILHQHGSYPDSKSEEGEAFGFDELKIENKKLKDAIQRRTIELERNNRELEIETALEKVRSKSLAMHHTSELQDVIHTVHEELLKLDIPIVGGSFVVINSEIDTELYAWGAGGTAQTVQRIHIPHFDMPFGTNLMDGIKQGSGFFTEYFSQEEKIAYFTELFKHPPWSGLSKKEKKATLGSSGDYTRSVMVSKHTTIFLINHNGRKFTEDENNILKRFARTFEQAYTRFLDLQKAEAQAREAQVEAALERVRAASMAINKTGDLNNIISTVFTQLKLLGFNNVECEIILFESEKMDCKIWPSNEAENVLPRSYHIPYNKYKIYQFLLNSWKSGSDYCHYELKGMSKKAWENWLFNQTDWKNIPEVVQKSMRDVKKVFLYGATMSHGILEIGSTQRLEDGMFEIIQRFAKVFEQSYTRFLDLQLAEEQAREAEIQLALERVRARTMAMQKSDELPEAANLLFNQVQSLGMPAWSAGYCIWEDDHQAIKAWMSSEGVLQPPFVAPTTEDELFMEMRIGHEVGKNFHMVEMGGEELVDHYKYMRTLPIVGEILDSIIEAGHPLPTFQIMHYAYFSHGLLLFITYEPVPEAHDIFKRFAKVFEQTYTRFLDLQKAEAQAKEAQIEAALEKVRSRSLAMHKAEELGAVVTVVVEKLRELEIPVDDGVAIVTNIEGSKDQIEWMENPGFPSAIKFNQPYFDHPVLRDYWKAKNEGLDFIAPRYTAEENKTFLNHIFELSDYKNTPKEVKDYCLSAESYSYSAAFQKNSSIFINDYSGRTLTKEEIDIVKRFSRVFEQAYVRFLDLQKAEEQAREAKIEAALERVRSRSMAMHKTEELSEVVKLLFEEIKPFGFAKSGCELILVDEKNDQLQFWNSNPVQDKILNCFNIPKSIHPFFQKQWKAWEDQVPTLTIVLEGQEKKEFDQLIFSKTDFKYLPDDVKKFILNHGNVDVFSHAIMKHGLLEVVDALPISEEMFSILERFAKVFEHTYTRFLDLKKAEEQAREAQIEAALEKIRAQSMMMQHSEELSTTSNVFHEQLLQLELPSEFSYVWLPNEENGTHMFWATWSENNRGKMIARSKAYTYPLDKSEPYTAACYNMWESNEDVFVNRIEPEEVEGFFSTWSELVGEAESLKAKNFPNGLYYAEAYMKYGCFGINIRRALDNKEQEVLRRFANEFERTYTRFLDLQRAEAQAREAKIEAALEKVRARAMGMHKSDELSDLVSLVFKELVALDMELTRCLIWVFNKDHSAQWWMANPEDEGKSSNFYIPNHDHPCYQAFIKAWSDNEKMWEYILEGEAKESFDQFLFNETNLKNLPRFVQDAMMEPDLVILTATFNNFGALQAAGLESLSEENKDILRRFGQVFDQTYTRFLDLQKAEAQAREAQIEASLERVRSRTMAMHNSTELAETALLLFAEIERLGIYTFASGFNIWDEKHENLISWMSNATGSIQPPFVLPIHAYNQHLEIYEAWKRKEDFLVHDIKGKAIIKHYKFLRSFPLLDESFKKAEAAGIKIPNRQVHNIALFSHGYLLFITLEPYPEYQDIFLRFGKVFEQTYTRFLDLQKAEAQAREAQIEVALERVRAASMAMHASEELKNVVKVIFDQLANLNINAEHAGIVVDYEPKNDWHFWIAETQDIPAKVSVPYLDLIWDRQFTEAKKNGKDFFVTQLDFEEKNKFYSTLLPHITGLSKEANDFYFGCPGLAISTVIENDIGLYIENFSGTPYTDEENNILKRFAKVFQQSYTRFLDLKKAEAQARESQIEASLERVRAKSMAMHKSEELADLSLELVKQVQALGVATWFCAFNIYDDDPAGSLEWGSNGMGTFPKYRTPREGIFLRYYEAGQKGEKLLVNEIGEDECPAHYEYLCTLPGVGDQLLKMKSDGIPFPTSQIDHVAYFKYGYVLFITYDPVPESYDVFKRFAKVFEQSYTRFLDLKRAEAQARESQIEAALEKVRAHTMAMQKSDELLETGAVLFKELSQLGIDKITCGYVLLDKDEKMGWNYGVNPGEGTIRPLPTGVPRSGTKVLASISESWEKQEPMLLIELDPQETINHQTYMAENSPNFTLTSEQLLALSPERLAIHTFNFKQGYLLLVGGTPLSADHTEIVIRFAKVFEQTYTRYLDLKKAEEQARKAKIEAALERVRARSMAMHSSDELVEASDVMFAELNNLDLNILRIGICTIDADTGAAEIWSRSEIKGKLKNSIVGVVPMGVHPVFDGMVHAWKSKKPFFISERKGEEVKDYYTKLAPYLSYPLPKVYNEKETVSTFFFSEGSLNVISIDPLTERECDIMVRFARVFGQMHTRFLDLQRAEAQAREAKKQAALDRVRGEIASMRSTEDLNRITPVIWRELQVMEVPFIRCGVFIVDEETKVVNAYLSSPDGQALGVLNLPFDINTQTTNTVKFWKQKKVYTEHWDAQDFMDWAKSMVDLGQIQNVNSYQGSTIVPESLHLHFIPFRQGMLYVGNVHSFSKDEIALVRTLAEAFSIAYARYEDFKNLEEAKNKIEVTLDELKAAQSQLIQSEKMASLGELTAGIAHEIQNPLNFVNNFSEVSSELVDELQEEIDKGDVEEVKIISNDLKENLGKIQHHGKRAESIVKGMLMHSRSSKGEKLLTDINALCDEFLRLSYHGLRAKDRSFNADFEMAFDETIPKIEVIPQDMGRVLLNLINNAFQATKELKPLQGMASREPKVKVVTRKHGDNIEILVIDNGSGISDDIKDKIFQPFFTTKPTGQGTGLGLSLAYDIVKAHGGEISVNSESSQGTTFSISLPYNNQT